MDRVFGKFFEVCSGSKTSTNKKDFKDVSNELIIWWNGSNINKCNSVVMQTLKLHFNSGPWHFTFSNVRSQMHKVSIVVNRVHHMKLTLTFMS